MSLKCLVRKCRTGQPRPGGYDEPALVTLGADLAGATDPLAVHRGSRAAAKAIHYLPAADLGLSHGSSDTAGHF